MGNKFVFVVVGLVVLVGGGLFYYFSTALSPSAMSRHKAAAMILAYYKQNPDAIRGTDGMLLACTYVTDASAQLESVTVTGITYPMPNTMQADFTETDQISPSAMTCMHSSTNTLTSDGKAIFQLFDDGWKVIHVGPTQIKLF
jgi:hypothetical protein